MLLMKLNDLENGVVISRPSKNIKTPYVADVKLLAEDGDGSSCGGSCGGNDSGNSSECILAHSPSLGCCGLADSGAHVLIGRKNDSKNKSKCSHTIYLSIYKENNKNNNKNNNNDSESYNEIVIGIHPKLAEELVEAAIKSNVLSILQNVRSYKREVVVSVDGCEGSRFDFNGIDKDGNEFVLEVKNVSLADYEDVCAKDRKKMDFSNREYNTKVAYFPDGKRKISSVPVSERALKHINDMVILKSSDVKKRRCIMCYVIQRNDVNRFQPSIVDQCYRNALYDALKKGVEIITLVVKWDKDGSAYFVSDNSLLVMK
jgi:DNA-binding sugar fermentation-stimulating protein